MSAVWGTVARLRELVTLRSEGNVRFEQQTGPEGAVPLAPYGFLILSQEEEQAKETGEPATAAPPSKL